jgi:hypothetical protein
MLLEASSGRRETKSNSSKQQLHPRVARDGAAGALGVRRNIGQGSAKRLPYIN